MTTAMTTAIKKLQKASQQAFQKKKLLAAIQVVTTASFKKGNETSGNLEPALFRLVGAGVKVQAAVKVGGGKVQKKASTVGKEAALEAAPVTEKNKWHLRLSKNRDKLVPYLFCREAVCQKHNTFQNDIY